MSIINSDYEIMIVGGGPAGISTWLHLHKYAPELAEKTLLIEKEQYPREKICGGGVQKWMTKKIFDNLQIDFKIPNISMDSLCICYGKEKYHYKEKDFFNIVRRIEFDYYLSLVSKKRGLNLHENEFFIDMQYRQSGLVVKTNKSQYQIKVLIGADGALSSVRQKMKSSVKLYLSPTLEITTRVNNKFDLEYDTKNAILDYTPVTKGIQGYIWHFPFCIDGIPMMNHGIVDFHLLKNRRRSTLKKILMHDLKKRHIPCNIESFKSHPIPYRLEHKGLSNSNILLVGDAAGIEPLLGGGIHLALTYGSVAASAIVDAFQNNDFAFNDYEQRIEGHYLGKYLIKLIETARYIYVNPETIISSIVNIFDIKKGNNHL